MENDLVLRTVRSAQNLQLNIKPFRLKRKSQLKGINSKLLNLKIKCKQLRQQSKTQRIMLHQLLTQNQNISNKAIEKMQQCNNCCSQIVNHIFDTKNIQSNQFHMQQKSDFDKYQEKQQFSSQISFFPQLLLDNQHNQNQKNYICSDRSTQISLNTSKNNINKKRINKESVKELSFKKSQSRKKITKGSKKQLDSIYQGYMFCVFATILACLLTQMLVK